MSVSSSRLAKFSLTSPPGVMERLRAFRKNLQRNILRKAGRAAAKPLKAIMIRNAPIETKTWRKSIGTKVVTYDKGGVPILWFAVGPRSGYVQVVAAKAKYYIDKQGRLRRIPAEKADQSFLRKPRRPVNYSHLIEKGTKAGSGGGGGVLSGDQDELGTYLVKRRDPSLSKRRARAEARSTMRRATKAHHTIERSMQQARRAMQQALTTVLTQAMASI